MNEQEIREKTKNSIARLIAHRRGAEVADDKDEITASNILFVCSRLIEQIGNQRELEGYESAYKGGYAGYGGLERIAMSDGPEAVMNHIFSESSRIFERRKAAAQQAKEAK